MYGVDAVVPKHFIQVFKKVKIQGRCQYWRSGGKWKEKVAAKGAKKFNHS